MPVSGVVIRVDAARITEVESNLNLLGGVDVLPERTSQTLVAVLDAEDFEAENNLTRTIQDMDGVENLTLSYHNFEDMVDA